MKKYIFIILVAAIIFLVLLFLQNNHRSNLTNSESPAAQNNPSAHLVCTADESKLATTTGMVYVNTVLNFSIYLPKGWIVPQSDNNDPHFVNCADQDGFEIHSTSMGPEQLYSTEYNEYIHQSFSKTIKIFDNIIANALVREYALIDPEEGDGWPRTHVILFEKAQKAFFFLSENPIDRYPFISTFKLLESPITSTSSSVSENKIKSYSYLFEEKREPNTSNIIGYFGGGAFAWYVPDWLANNWEMKQFREQGMIFAPKVQDNIEDFSNIIFDVSTSTELNNAENLAYTKQHYIPNDEIITNEVVLNKNDEGMVSIQMETNTRIHHIVAYTSDFRRITDMYFMDGNGKTLEITFEAKKEYFPQFSDKIRNLVEGIGELKSLQG